MDNEYDDIIEFTTTSKKFLVPGIWEDISDDELLKLYEEAYDRWNFETGSDGDFKAMEDLEKEIKYRKYVNHCVNILSEKDYKEIMEGLIVGNSK